MNLLVYQLRDVLTSFHLVFHYLDNSTPCVAKEKVFDVLWKCFLKESGRDCGVKLVSRLSGNLFTSRLISNCTKLRWVTEDSLFSVIWKRRVANSGFRKVFEVFLNVFWMRKGMTISHVKGWFRRYVVNSFTNYLMNRLLDVQHHFASFSVTSENVCDLLQIEKIEKVFVVFSIVF